MKPCNPWDRPCPAPCPPPPCRDGFLFQRILACGKLHRRPECVFCKNLLPPQAQPPFRVLEANVNGPCTWRETSCACNRYGLSLQVTVPISLRLEDSCGRRFSVDVPLEEELTLRPQCPNAELWHGQIFLQAAVCPWRGCGPRQGNEWDVTLELLLEGYLLSPCPVRCPTPACPPDPRPLYPQPRFNPYNDF